MKTITLKSVALKSVAMALMIVMSLSACGIKGPLKPPSAIDTHIEL